MKFQLEIFKNFFFKKLLMKVSLILYMKGSGKGKILLVLTSKNVKFSTGEKSELHSNCSMDFKNSNSKIQNTQLLYTLNQNLKKKKNNNNK